MTEKRTGTCPTCGREGLTITREGVVWPHNHPTNRTKSGIFRLPCDGGKPAEEGQG